MIAWIFTFASRVADASWESMDKTLKSASLLTSKKTSSSPQTICHVIKFSGHHRQTPSNPSTDGRLLQNNTGGLK